MYISEPIICLYKVASTTSEVSSFKSFKLVVIEVVIDLQSNIPNLFNISKLYFPYLGKYHLDIAILQDLENNASYQGLSFRILQKASSYIQ